MKVRLAGPMPPPVALTAEARAELAEAAADRHDWVSAASRPDRPVIRGDCRLAVDLRASATDRLAPWAQ